MDEASVLTDDFIERGAVSTRRIRLRCGYNGELRNVILRYPEDSLVQLRKRLSNDYGFEVALKYEDDGDLIILSSQNDLDDLVAADPDRDSVNIVVAESTNHLPVLARRDQSKQQIFAAGGGGGGGGVFINQYQLPPADGPRRLSSQASFERFPQIDGPAAGAGRRSSVRWKRGEVLGQGAFGVVCLGLNVETGELMAVKQMAIEELSKKDLSALENEINLLRSFRHPNIVRYIGTEANQAHLSIFLEYVPGGSLKALIDKFGALEESVAKVRRGALGAPSRAHPC